MMKKLTVLTLCLALAVSFLATLGTVSATSADPSATDTPAATDTPSPTPSPSIEGYIIIDDKASSINKTPRLVQYQTWSGGTLCFRYLGSDAANIRIESVELIPSIDINKFPFDVSLVNYIKSNDDPSTLSTSLIYTLKDMRVRGDAPAGFYDILFKVRFTKRDATNSSIVVAEGVEEKTMRVLVSPASTPVTEDGQIAKVIVSASTTNPTEVVAGENFVLGVTFKNTSSEHTISNLKASLAGDSTFKPVSGSSTLFIASIGPGESKSASLRLTSKSDTAPGSYTASFSLNYDAPNTKDHAPVTDTEVIAIPVKQVPHVMTTKLQIQPSEIFVGQDINVMSTVNNTGKSKIYNLNVSVDDSKNLLAASEAYLGNIDSGGTGTVDLYITPTGAGDTTVTMHVSYEDENGSKYTTTETADISVMDSAGGGEVYVPDIVPEQQPKSLWWLWLILGLVVAGVVLLIVLKKRKAGKNAARDRAAVKELNDKYLKEQSLKETKSGQEAKK